MRIVVCVKWGDTRPEIDPLSGEVTVDARRGGFSAADEAAFETALHLAQEWSATVAVLSVRSDDDENGPDAETLDAALRAFAAAGGDLVDRVVRVEGGDAASGIAEAVAGADLVVCGDVSLDGGSGATPAFVAHRLGAAQALGVVGLSAPGEGVLEATRRLGGGRTERVRVRVPAVVSVEGSVARLRRASLPAVQAAATRPVEVRRATDVPSHHGTAHERERGAWRPRAHLVAAPVGSPRERIVSLTGALVDRTPPRIVETDPQSAADTIVEQLREWGYLA